MNKQSLYKMLLMAIVITGTAQAEELNYGSMTPTKEQIIQVFKPGASEQIQTAAVGTHPYEGDVAIGRERNISFKLDQAKPVHVAAARAERHAKSHSKSAISMQILFDYKSAQLTDAAKEKLRPVGEALASNELKNIDFTVEGHTDAIGGDAYNDQLSIQRAASVKKYLISNYHVNSDRINAIGRGEHHLLDPHNPESDVNRRVRIVAMK